MEEVGSSPKGRAVAKSGSATGIPSGKIRSGALPGIPAGRRERRTMGHHGRPVPGEEGAVAGACSDDSALGGEGTKSAAGLAGPAAGGSCRGVGAGCVSLPGRDAGLGSRSQHGDAGNRCGGWRSG